MKSASSFVLLVTFYKIVAEDGVCGFHRTVVNPARLHSVTSQQMALFSLKSLELLDRDSCMERQLPCMIRAGLQYRYCPSSLFYLPELPLTVLLIAFRSCKRSNEFGFPAIRSTEFFESYWTHRMLKQKQPNTHKTTHVLSFCRCVKQSLLTAGN